MDGRWDSHFRMRDLWDLDPDVAHLNHGSFGAVPRPVGEAQAVVRSEVDRNPNDFFVRALPDRLADARRRAAAFLGADASGVAFVENATAGVNTVLSCVRFEPSDELLLTDHVYGAVLKAAERVCARTGARLVVRPVPLEGDVAADVLSGVGERTRLVILDHVASPTALVFPVDEIVRALRERDVLCLVDAAHVPGMLPVSLVDLNADFWVGNFHKWAFAPRGAAALWVRPELRELVSPLAASHELDQGFPRSFDWVGTRDYSAWLCVPAALDFLEALGAERLRKHNTDLAATGAKIVAERLGSPPPSRGPASMSLVSLPDGAATTPGDALALSARISSELRAEVAVLPWNGHGWLRLSAQAYNAVGEYERLADGLPRLFNDGACHTSPHRHT